MHLRISITSCLLLMLVSVLPLTAQHIYVRAVESAPTGWLVDSTAQTVFEVPPGWRLYNDNSQMALIEAWPVLFEHYPRRDSANFAFLREGGKWEELTAYTSVRPLGQSCFSLEQGRDLNSILWCAGEAVPLKQTVVLGQFSSQELAIARQYKSAGQSRLDGLVNKQGEWVLPPQATALFSVGHGRYSFQDSTGQRYLLRAVKKREGTSVDTILNLGEAGWALRPQWPFDETGHSWAMIDPQQMLVVDTNGLIQSDTLQLTRSSVTPFQEGLSWLGRPHQLVDVHARPVRADRWPYVLPAQEGLLVVQDTTSGYFGYLNKEGDWAIPPVYCFATSFRDGWALTTGQKPENCGNRVNQRRASAALPSYLQRYGPRGYFELIDQSGEVVFRDSCRELFLLPGRIIGRNQGVGSMAPAVRIDWLEEGKYWLSPDYHFLNWRQLGAAQPEEVRRVSLGVPRYTFGLTKAHFALPEDFTDHLASWSNLQSLNLNNHQVVAYWPQLLQKRQLERLSLRGCELEALPEAISELESLKELDISDNELTELPKALYRMRHLEVLNIAANPLPPATIPRLRKRLPQTKIIYKREW